MDNRARKIHHRPNPSNAGTKHLKLDLELEEELGTNPYKFGMVASSDNHTALATMAEDNFFGKFAESDLSLRHDRRWGHYRADR